MARIFHVVHVRWWSAIAAYAVDLAEAQAHAGEKVLLSVLRGSPVEHEARRRGLTEITRVSGEITGEIGLCRRLRALCRDGRVDVLHVHTGSGHIAAELARRAMFPNVPLVRTRADCRPLRFTPWIRWLYGSCDRLVLSTRAFAEPFRTLVASERIAIVPGGTDVEWFHPPTVEARNAARRALGLPADRFLAGVVARFSPVKGHRFVLDALARLAKHHPTLDLVIAGEDAQLDAASLREEASARGLGARVHWYGRVADVRGLLWALDAGVVASIGSEAVCRIAGEYMASGLPVVATRVGVLPEMIVDGKTGLLVAPRDAEGLAAALASLVQEPERGVLMGRHGRERAVSQYSLAVIRDTYRALYGLCASGGSTGVNAGSPVRASR